MKTKESRMVIVALSSGVIQYYLLLILLGCIYPAIPQSTVFVIFALITSAITIAITTIYSCKQTFTRGVLCFVIMLIALLGTTILNAYTRTIIKIQQLLKISTSISSDNASGMLAILYIITVVVTGIAMLLIIGLKNLKKDRRTGWFSVLRKKNKGR